MPDSVAELRALLTESSAPPPVPRAPAKASPSTSLDELRSLVAEPEKSTTVPPAAPSLWDRLSKALTFTEPRQPVETQPKGAYFNPKTGTWTHPPAPGEGVLDQPIVGVPQLGRGAAHLVTGEGGRMNAASDVLEGAMKTAEPAMVAAAVVNPFETLAALTAGVAGQEATAKGVTALGGSPEAARLAGNVGGIVTGGVGATAASRARPRLLQALRPADAVATPLEAPNQVPDAVATPPITTSSAPEATSLATDAAPTPIEELQELVDPREPPVGAEPVPAKPQVPTTDVVDRVREKVAAGEPLGSPEARDAFAQQQHVEAARDGTPVDELRSLVGEDHAAQDQEPVAEAETPVGAEAAAAEDGQPQETESSASPRPSDLSDAHLREIRRIVHELDAMGYTDTTWNDRSQEAGLNDGNAGGGQFDRRPRVAGAKVYDDIYQMAPGSAKASRAAVQAQLERFLVGGKPTNAVKGAIEIARLRMGKKYRIPGDGPLSTPEMAIEVGDHPTRLEPKPDLPTEDAGPDVAALGDWFKQQAAAEPAAPPSTPIDELRDLLDTGEEQPRLPGAGAVRDQEIATPQMPAPFSLTPTAVEPAGAQADLFKPEKPTFGEWQKQQAPKDITLQSTLVPGAKEFGEQDLAPIARGAGEMVREAKNFLSPQTASPNAQASADIVRGAKARVANANAIEESKYSKIANGFAKMSDADNIANIAEYERTGKFSNAPHGYSTFYKKSMDEAGRLLERAYGGDIVGKVENYVRRAFVFGSKADEQRGSDYLTTKLRSLSANKSPTKARVLDMPLDEALANMQRRGINVKPATANPELLRQWSIGNARQAVAYKKAWADLEARGMITYAKAGGRVPDGFAPLDDRVATRFFATERGLVKAGQYYAEPNVARVLNNAISRGFENSPTYRGLRAINNSMNQLQLGLSGFHATGTAINAGISDLALGVRKMARGDVKGGAAATARSLVPGASFARDLFKGDKLIRGLKTNNPEAYELLQSKINPSGARLHIEQRYQNKAFENMRTAFANKNYVGAALRLPLAVVEQTARPLMSYAIPRVKIGALLDVLNDVDARMPDASPVEKARAYAAASDSIDNRFGQLVHDNLFWNKTASDLSQLATRSVGWNLGTVREIGGGLADVAKLAHGDVTDRLLYTAALPVYVGMIGAVYQYLHTGEKPSELKDYFYPKNGRSEPNGMVSRTTLPTYMKDVEAYASHPIDTISHKQSPILDFAGTLMRNEDYFGNLIRNPDDPIATQLQQLGAFTLREIAPFSVQQLQRSEAEQASPEGRAESFMGFVKAPATMERTPAETMMHDFLGPQATTRTPEQADKADVKRELRGDLKAGDTAAAKALVDKGQVGRRSIMDAARSANLTGIQTGFKQLTLDQALRVYEVATPAQRGALRPLLSRKVATLRDAAPEDMPDLEQRLSKAGQLPFSPPSLMTALQPAAR